MDIDEKKELEDKIRSLTSKSNSWERMVEFFESNKSIKEYYDDVSEECRRNQSFGYATIMILTIEKLLEKIDDLKDDVKYLEGIAP